MRSSLDMGRHPELVRPGSTLGSVPTAARIVRRKALVGSSLDEDLRLGEDVDVVWRLAEAGGMRGTAVFVGHGSIPTRESGSRGDFEYGTSAAAVEERHPGNLTAARVSARTVVEFRLLAAGRPVPATAVTGAATSARRPACWPPNAWEWATQRPSLDPVRYTPLPLLDDAAYGTGVIANCVRKRDLSPVTPDVRLPGRPAFRKRRRTPATGSVSR